MWLLDKMLRGYVKRGELTVIDHEGQTYRHGKSDAEFRPVTVRIADGRVVRDIVRDPGLGAAEAFMDGRLIVQLTMFRDAPMGVYQTEFLKRRDATPLIRDYMFGEEGRLRATADRLELEPARAA
jgi:hypothetical protein